MTAIRSFVCDLSRIDSASNGVLIAITKSRGENLRIGVSPVRESASEQIMGQFHHCRNQAFALRMQVRLRLRKLTNERIDSILPSLSPRSSSSLRRFSCIMRNQKARAPGSNAAGECVAVNLISSSELAVGSWPAFSQLAKPSRIQLLGEITSNYYGHLAQRITSIFLLKLRCWHIPPRRERDHRLSYILNAT